MKRSAHANRRRHVAVWGVLATVVGALVFACGSDDGIEAEPCTGPTCEIDGGPDTKLDVELDGRTDAADAADVLDGGAKCTGEAGALDPSFGDGGRLVPPLTGAGGAAVTYQPDGKLLIGGQHIDAFAVLRFTSNGTPDGSFGTAGLATAAVGATRGIVRAMALQADGKIVAVGQSRTNDDDIAIARFLPNGNLDSSFGTGGVVILDLGGTDDSAAALAIEGDGSILVSGTTAPKNSGSYDFVLLRYTSGGTLDATYGSAGKAQIDVRASSDQLGALVWLPTGQAIVAGYSSGTSPALRYDPSLVRFEKDGALDQGFGAGGKVVTDFGPPYPRVVNSIGLDANGFLIVGGGAGLGPSQDFAIYRFSPDGVSDTTFGAAGLVHTDLGGQEAVSAVGAAKSGRIFAAGSTDGPTGRRVFGVVAYLANGSIDPSFGIGGKVVTDFGAPVSVSLPGMFVADCELTLAASATTVVGGLTTTQFVIARYMR